MSEIVLGHWTGVTDHGDMVSEYTACTDGVGLHDRSYRSLLRITGRDRLDWLHNFTTNVIRTLDVGDGVYAFATDLKGRILFDMNVLTGDDAILLDIEGRQIADAHKHLSRYIITEDVHISDVSDETSRLSLIGPRAAELLVDLGLAGPPATPLLQLRSLTLLGREITCFKHDLLGKPAYDLLVPAAAEPEIRAHILGHGCVTPVGYTVADMLRIEAGIPWPVSEINADVLPAETGQSDRAVSNNKGCYLGQEIVERMRSRGSVARHLVQIRFDDGEHPQPGVDLHSDDRVVGRVTSVCHSFKNKSRLALAYVRADHADPNMILHVETSGGQVAGTVFAS
jgi:folate-binding protein YgfZ